MKSVKYLFKYVYKGHDCANMEMAMEEGEARDEIKLYLNFRYVIPTIMYNFGGDRSRQYTSVLCCVNIVVFAWFM